MLRRRMIFAVIGLGLALAALTMSTCNIAGFGTLTIRNYSTSNIDFVTWRSHNGTLYDFGEDLVWDTTTLAWEYGLRSLGGRDARDVDFGSDYIYFFFTTSGIGHRTVEAVDVNLFTDGSFTFYNSTAIFTITRPDGSTESKVYSIVPVPGLTKPTK